MAAVLGFWGLFALSAQTATDLTDWDPNRLADEINAELKSQGVENALAAVSAQGVMISLFNTEFLADSPELTEMERARLRVIAEILTGIPQRKILIAGHTAPRGTRAEQYAVTERRAKAAASYLVFLKARSLAEIKTVGYGADIPVARNSTYSGMGTNRRVEITILEY